MTAPLVTIVIATANGLKWLPGCIDALRQQTRKDFEVVVVDNASSDGSTDWLAQQPDIRTLHSPTNLGFAGGMNRGIRESQSPFVVVLNDDTQVLPNWLDELIIAAQSHSRIGACASLLVFAHDPDMVQSAGINIDRAAIAWDRLGGQPASEAQEPCDIFGASGGAVLYRREMLDQIGLYDERFFMYLEDVDLAWRAQRAGWRCRYVPTAKVIHFTSASAGEGSPFKMKLLGRNKVWLVAKNAPVQDWPVIVLYDLAAVFYAGLQRGNWVHLHGRLAGLRQVHTFLRERKTFGQCLCSANWCCPGTSSKDWII
ncbi:MAG: glycosyltransferase family 2 protein [Anaerolineae bacterium]|nr:glycosyltransferase family 2 protein [Anaerolineae bacterium]